MRNNNIKSKERISLAQKEANGFEWFKNKIDLLDTYHRGIYNGNETGISDYKRMQVNYDLFNNKINLKDLEYVCRPYGNEIGELPASMTNKDISSGPIKTMLGLEMKRPSAWTVVATNAEATSAREQEEFNQFRDYVVGQAIAPLRKKIEMEKAQAAQGGELTPDQQNEISQQIEQELAARTPEHIKKYMKREYQDPAEIQSIHLLKYLIKNLDTDRKFNNIFKHGLLSGTEIGFVGIENKEPVVREVNPKRFRYDKTTTSGFIEDGEWCTYSEPLKPSEIISRFDLTDEEIDQVYESWNTFYNENFDSDLFLADEINKDYDSSSSIEVVHCQWKSLRRIGFLTYIDIETGEERGIPVDETYKINPEVGDIHIEWEWIPETYEGYKIKVGEPIYKNMGPVKNQIKSIENSKMAKLSYYGCSYDDTNSASTSLMDRYINFQYYYNIIMYKIELLIASDKGKKVMMNIGAIPTSSGIDIEKWQYLFEATPFMYYDPKEEGADYQDANTLAKVIDLSVASDIQKYWELAEYIRKQAGQSVGLTDPVLGQIGPREAVTNTQQSIVQSSHILEMYFEVHGYVKRNILAALLETAKIAYADSKPRKLSYVLDDMSIQMFDLDINKLNNAELGLFVENSMQVSEAKETIKNLAHAALQNQKIELSDLVSILRNTSIVESEETLKVAEERRREQENSAQQQQIQANAEEAEKAREFQREEWQHEIDLAIIKEEEKRKTVIAGNALMGMSFNPDSDTDQDGVNDFLEIAKHGLNADVKKSELQIKRDALEHKKAIDMKKLENEDKKIENDKAKIAMANRKNTTK